MVFVHINKCVFFFFERLCTSLIFFFVGARNGWIDDGAARNAAKGRRKSTPSIEKGAETDEKKMGKENGRVVRRREQGPRGSIRCDYLLVTVNYII